MIKVKARYSNGKLTPLEPIGLKGGEEVAVSIDDKPQLSYEERLARFKAAAVAWKGLHDPDEFKRMIYQARIDGSRHTPKP
ncbi:MAG: antitoxin family protein [Chloroflexi bacterium]|nr:antitoxin family protein [Chloroflexota bacterium]